MRWVVIWLSMNRDEQIAYEFLKDYLGKEPTFEPDGNVPPDFSYRNLGIEVRRLNQNYFDEETGEAEGLEIVSYNIHNILSDVLPSYDDRYSGSSYFTAIRYQRPLGLEYKDFKDRLKSGLDNFLNKDQETPYRFKINDEISIRIIEGTPKPNKVFRHGITSDWDGGGWVIPMITENITYCISEKSKKIQNYKDNYTKWWLLLVDYLNISWSDEDVEDLIDEDIEPGEFQRVLVVEPSTKELTLEFK